MRPQPRTILGGFLAGLILVLAVVPDAAQQGPIPQNACRGPWPGARHRAYWADKAILDGTWTPPKVEQLKVTGAERPNKGKGGKT
ncbi:MAG: hypothetical protein Q7O12_02565 [Deltaproteobacteria bacterium]|nr:hypothetical protein [Deltaproteobacteria bacterium]